MISNIVPLLRQCVAINSISSTMANGPGEDELARWIAAWLNDQGVQAWILPADEGRLNVVAQVRGRGNEGPLLLNAHMDTVGTENMTAPFELKEVGDKLYGRGAYDMQGSIALMMALAADWKKHPPRRDLWLTFVSDEEDLSRGSEALTRDWLRNLDYLPTGAIILEPTEEAIGIAHRGFTWCSLTVQGQAAHGSLYNVGVDAILPLGAALTTLAEIEQRLQQVPPHPLLGRGSLHASLISGGEAWSIYPPLATLQWERRTLPDETPAMIEAEVEDVVRAVRRAAGDAKVSGQVIFGRAGFETESESAVVWGLQALLPDAPIVGLPFWTDGALFAPHIPTVIFGPIGSGAHTPEEWISRASLERVYGVLKELVL